MECISMVFICASVSWCALLARRRPPFLTRINVPTENQYHAIRRQMGLLPEYTSQDYPYLRPVAIPNIPQYLQMAADAIIQFNEKGLQLTPYLESTCRLNAATLRIQSVWRGCFLRGIRPTGSLTLMTRAAKRIQRVWRACECIQGQPVVCWLWMGLEGCCLLFTTKWDPGCGDFKNILRELASVKARYSTAPQLGACWCCITCSRHCLHSL